MAMPGVHEDVQTHLQSTVSTHNAGVCRCGAVFDHGNVSVPLEYRGMCGRCAVARGLRIGTSDRWRTIN